MSASAPLCVNAQKSPEMLGFIVREQNRRRIVKTLRLVALAIVARRPKLHAPTATHVAAAPAPLAISVTEATRAGPSCIIPRFNQSAGALVPAGV